MDIPKNLSLSSLFSLQSKQFPCGLESLLHFLKKLEKLKAEDGSVKLTNKERRWCDKMRHWYFPMQKAMDAIEDIAINNPEEISEQDYMMVRYAAEKCFQLQATKFSACWHAAHKRISKKKRWRKSNVRE